MSEQDVIISDTLHLLQLHLRRISWTPGGEQTTPADDKSINKRLCTVKYVPAAWNRDSAEMMQ